MGDWYFWLPASLRGIAYLLVGVGWMLLFAYGMVRMLIAHEWGYACVCVPFVVVPMVMLWQVWRGYSRDAQRSPESEEPPQAPPEARSGELQ